MQDAGFEKSGEFYGAKVIYKNRKTRYNRHYAKTKAPLAREDGTT